MGTRGRRIPMSQELFTECIWQFVRGEITLEQAAERLGRHPVTITKWFNMVLNNEELPSWVLAPEAECKALEEQKKKNYYYRTHEKHLAYAKAARERKKAKKAAELKKL